MPGDHAPHAQHTYQVTNAAGGRLRSVDLYTRWARPHATVPQIHAEMQGWQLPIAVPTTHLQTHTQHPHHGIVARAGVQVHNRAVA